MIDDVGITISAQRSVSNNLAGHPLKETSNVMAEKYYITAEELLEDSYRLGAQIIESDFHPDFIVGIWRGGSPVGIAVQEMLEYFNISTDHISVRTSLYTGISSTSRNVRVHGLDYLVKNLNAENALLIIDRKRCSSQDLDHRSSRLWSRLCLPVVSEAAAEADFGRHEAARR